MSYITLSNTKKIIYESAIKDLKLNSEIYKIPIHFFNNYEENELLAIQELLKDPRKYFSDIYTPFRPYDTFTMVYEGESPSYHKFSKCPRLLSDYQNFRLPDEIKKRGESSVREYRKWFDTVKHLGIYRKVCG